MKGFPFPLMKLQARPPSILPTSALFAAMGRALLTRLIIVIARASPDPSETEGRAAETDMADI